MFIYRDEVYNPDTEPGRSGAHRRQAPQRSNGHVRLAFMNQYTKFASHREGGAPLTGFNLPRRIRTLLRRLTKDDPPFEPKPRRPIVDELVLTVLSQATSDLNSGRAFERLTARFSSWDEVLAAPVDEVADAIRSGGIADVKARRIQAILQAIEEREGQSRPRSPQPVAGRGGRGLPRLAPGGRAQDRRLRAVVLDGAGCVPGRTHVFRVCRRLGLIAPKDTAEGAHRTLGQSVPPDIRYRFHIALIRHGRTICKPRVPLCSECVVFDLCEAGPELLAAGEAR